MKKLLFIPLLFNLTLGGIELIPNRLTIDGLLWCNALFRYSQTLGWGKTGFELQYRQATLGLTTNIIKNRAAMRLEYDFSKTALRDLFVNFKWEPGFTLRVGQFKLPLSFECETDERLLRFEEYTILYYYNVLKPTEPRDIGMMLLYQLSDSQKTNFRTIFGIINGTGPNTADNNNHKDFFGRVLIKPLPKIDLHLACRAYYGWTKLEAVPWLGLGAEFSYHRHPLTLNGEFALRRYENASCPTGTVQVTGVFPLFNPAVRLEIARWEDGKIQWRGMAGLNFPLLNENLIVLLGYQYQTLINSWQYQAVIIRLQAGF